SQTLTGNTSVTANFELSGETIIPAVIASNTTLTTGNSPYTASGDITVQSGTTLTIQPGVTVRMPDGASIYVNGTLDINGTGTAPVTIGPRADSWGAIGFTGATGNLSHLILSGATHTGDDPVNLRAAIAGLDSTIAIDHAEISAAAPVFARGGSLTVRSSYIHPETTGDGVNVKGGDGLVEDCTFLGNDAPDTDAIDFDGVTDGIIRNNRIYAFIGSNSDAIDIGEGCVNLLLENNRIYNSSDKGVSVGQGSVVNMRHNLIVGCALGVGVKDAGSVANIDQNTFAGNHIAVASYEKNFNKGGGQAYITNSIFSRSKDDNTTVDPLSTLTVSYSLSDTLALPAGIGNLIADPLFTNPGGYDFSLGATSPAIDTGDPTHAPDPDTSRADIGAAYVYSSDDYPFQIPNVIVINEILSHSSAVSGDWIELHNTSSKPVDISGWYLSDSAGDLQKYRIADDTSIPALGYLVFTEADHFGAGSSDPGSSTGFAYSENGETAYLYGPGGGLLLEYLEEESFGPSAEDISRGRHFKASTNTFNFVAMATQTRGTANSLPRVGPVVISEIHYHPDTGDAEYLELLNISDAPVTLYDPTKDTAWAITAGLTYSFPTATPVTITPASRCLLVRSEAAFRSAFNVPAGTQIFQWTSGGLSNGGERIELSSPGDLDNDGVRKFIREDRVEYSDNAPWPTAADGGLKSLIRRDVSAYGNDPANWVATTPSPGQNSYEKWASDYGVTGKRGDADLDGLSNFLEYATGTNPTSANTTPNTIIAEPGGNTRIAFQVSTDHPELSYRIERSPDLKPGSWIPVPAEILPYQVGSTALTAFEEASRTQMYYRLVVGE
ncbi:MAG: lamin tail domain-containing protein, partial [Verrucomicrobiales bacterium]|nr:lamin tail domain-containing protein [Verrucomicrobiales bacterium]